MVGLNLTISAITLNGNEPNAPLERQRLSGWLTAGTPIRCCSQKAMYFKYKQ
jgi:hypothetical protein